MMLEGPKRVSGRLGAYVCRRTVNWSSRSEAERDDGEHHRDEIFDEGSRQRGQPFGESSSSGHAGERGAGGGSRAHGNGHRGWCSCVSCQQAGGKTAQTDAGHETPGLGARRGGRELVRDELSKGRSDRHRPDGAVTEQSGELRRGSAVE